MNSRERIISVVKKRDRADKIPWTFNFGATQGLNPTLLLNFKKRLGIDEYIYDFFDYDVINVNAPEKTGSNFIAGGIALKPNGINPSDYYDTNKLPNGFIDAWGVYTVPWELDPTFDTFINPLKNADDLKTFERYPSPTIDEEALLDIRKQTSEIKSRNKMSTAYSGSLYEWCGVIRGQEEFMMDLYDEPKFVEVLVEKVASVTRDMCLAAVKNGVDLIACYDDFGMQTSLQISPEHWRRYIKPAWKMIWDSIRKENSDAIIFLHSCGCIEEIIPDLIEMGLDVLHPIQPETMDVYEISKKYQKDIAIWGTISNQQTMPFGSPQDVTNEVRDRMEKLGSKGGFILSPSNVLGPEVPLDNLIAFVEAAKKYSV
ncbi:MAG: hypothetical protein GX862_11835 [Leucobacter sp.]|jgi:uroporphyrinogen decarboxylase|nr:hypothetical protein [Leucobacter sp.]